MAVAVAIAARGFPPPLAASLILPGLELAALQGVVGVAAGDPLKEWRLKGGWQGLRGKLYKLLMELSKRVEVKIQLVVGEECGGGAGGGVAAAGEDQQQEQVTEIDIEMHHVGKEQQGGDDVIPMEARAASEQQQQQEQQHLGQLQQQQEAMEVDHQQADVPLPPALATPASVVNTSSSTPATPATAAPSAPSAAGDGGSGSSSCEPRIRLSLQYLTPTWENTVDVINQVQQLARLIAAADAREVVEGAAKAAGADHTTAAAAIAAAVAARRSASMQQAGLDVAAPVAVATAATAGSPAATAASNIQTAAASAVTPAVTASHAAVAAADPAAFATAVAAAVAAAEAPSSSKQLLGVVAVPLGWQSGKKFSGQAKLPGSSSLLTVAADDDPSKVAAAVDCAALGLLGAAAVTNRSPGGYRWGDVEVMMLVLCRQCPWLREQTIPAAANAR